MMPSGPITNGFDNMKKIELASDVSYMHIDLPNGPSLHFLYQNGWRIDCFSISITVKYGGMHLILEDVHGAKNRNPIGTPHFMEHFLVKYSMDVLKDLEKRYNTSINALVTPDQSIWYVKHADAPPDKRVEAACDVIQKLLRTLSPNVEKQKILNILEHTKQDIRNEIVHRFNKISYKIQIELLSDLYKEKPGLFDVLGNEKTLESIGIDNVIASLKVIGCNISSINIVGLKTTQDLVDKVSSTVLTTLRGKEYEDTLTALAIQNEPFRPSHRIKGIRIHTETDDIALVCMGIKLPPFRSNCSPANEIVRRYLLSYLIANDFNWGLTGILNQEARAWLVEGRVKDALFFMDESKYCEVRESLKLRLLQGLQKSRARLEGSIEMAYLTIIETQISLLRICHVASSSGFSFPELISGFNEIQIHDLNRLCDEIRNTNENISLVFASKYAELF